MTGPLGNVRKACVMALVVLGAIAARPWAAESSAAMDPVAWSQVQQLRVRLHLTDEDLAALGCTQANAEAVLASLKSWRDENKAAVEPILSHAAARALAQALQRAGTDSAVDAGRLATLRQAAADAATQERGLMAAATTRLQALMSDDQRSAWAVMRQNSASLRSCRYAPNLTAEQRKQIAAAYRVYAAGAAEASSESQSLTAKATLDASVANILTADQKTAVERAQANLQRCMPGVLAAAEAVLPKPKGLLDDYVGDAGTQGN